MMLPWTCGPTCCHQDAERCVEVPLLSEEGSVNPDEESALCIIRQLVRQQSVRGPRASSEQCVESLPRVAQELGNHEILTNQAATFAPRSYTETVTGRSGCPQSCSDGEWSQYSVVREPTSLFDSFHDNADNLDDNDCPELTTLRENKGQNNMDFSAVDLDECVPPALLESITNAGHHPSMGTAFSTHSRPSADDMPPFLQGSQQELAQRADCRLGANAYGSGTGLPSVSEMRVAKLSSQTSWQVPVETPVGAPPDMCANGQYQLHSQVGATYQLPASADPWQSRGTLQARVVSAPPVPGELPLPRWSNSARGEQQKDLSRRWCDVNAFESDSQQDLRENSGIAQTPLITPTRRGMSTQICAELARELTRVSTEQSGIAVTPANLAVSGRDLPAMPKATHMHRQTSPEALPADLTKGIQRVSVPKLDLQIVHQRSREDMARQATKLKFGFKPSENGSDRMDTSSCCACLAWLMRTLDSFDPDALWRARPVAPMKPSSISLQDIHLPSGPPPMLKDAPKGADLPSTAASGPQAADCESDRDEGAHRSPFASSRTSEGWSDLASARLYYPAVVMPQYIPPIVSEEAVLEWREEVAAPVASTKWKV